MIELHNCDNLELMGTLTDESIDIICIDPPYLYLKNQKLERVFDETKLFSECKRLLTKNGFIVMFGRGTSFYRWNTILDGLGFTFKEEIIWDKSMCSSPLLPLSRVHETISIYCKGNANINRNKVPYLEMKQHDINSIIQDIKRMKSVFSNPKSLDAVNDFLLSNVQKYDEININKHKLRGDCGGNDRAVSVASGIINGLNEKSIIRGDRVSQDKFTKLSVTSDKRNKGDRSADVMQGVCCGLNEKSIIKNTRDHYSAIHPTQKPVRLLQRLLGLVIPQNKERNEIVVADFFAGSMSTMEAVYNMGMKGIATEIDEEYFNLGHERIKKITNQTKLF